MKLNDDDYNSTDEDLLFDDERRLKKEAGLRSMRTGTISVTPSSTLFWMIHSILSLFGSPW